MLGDPYAPLASHDRRDRLERYARYLEGRNGTPDVAARRLPRRDERLAAMPAAPAGDPVVDPERFRRALDGSEPADDPLLLWLVAVAKSNRNEHYAIERHLRLGLSFPRPHDRHVVLEEHYHSALILDALRAFGLEVPMGLPTRGVQLVLQAVEWFPEAVRMPSDLVGELAGAVLFAVLLEHVPTPSGRSAATERARGLLREVVVDEIDHVGYCRLRNTDLGRRLSPRLVDSVARSIATDVPEAATLAGGPDAFVARVRALDLGSDPLVRDALFEPPEAAAASVPPGASPPPAASSPPPAA